MSVNRTKKWGIAWVVLAVAIALHVIDEALTGFLPRYNSIVDSLRGPYPWMPLPTFNFSVWLAGLTIGVAVLLGLSPCVFRGNVWLRPISYFLGILMTGNALGHIGASFYLGILFPGVLLSPILLAAALTLLVTTFGSTKDP